MPAAAVVTIIAAVVVILVLAAFLLAIVRVLVGVNRTLGTVTGAVDTIISKTQPVDSVVRSIDGNLATARDVLSSLLESKVGADGAAQLVASVDPLAQAPAERKPQSAPVTGQRWPSEPSPPVRGRSAGSIQMRDDDEDDEPLEGEPFNAAAPVASSPPGLPPEPEAEPPEAERAAWPPSGLEPSPPVRGRSAGSIQMRDR